MNWTRVKLICLIAALLICAAATVTAVKFFAPKTPEPVSASPRPAAIHLPPATPLPVISRFCGLIDDKAATQLLRAGPIAKIGSGKFQPFSMPAVTLARMLSSFRAQDEMPVLSPRITTIDTNSSYIQDDVFGGRFRVGSSANGSSGALAVSGEAILQTMGDKTVRLTLDYTRNIAFTDGFRGQGPIHYQAATHDGGAVVFVGPPIHAAGLTLHELLVWIETRKPPATQQTTAWMAAPTTPH